MFSWGSSVNSLLPKRQEHLLKSYGVRLGNLKINEGAEGEKEAYVEVTAHLLDREIKEGRLQPGDQNEVALSFDDALQMVFYYRHPRTKEKVAIDLLILEPETEVAQAVAAYLTIIEPSIKRPYGFDLRAHCKGNIKAKTAPLERKSETLQAAPRDREAVYQSTMPRLLKGQPTRAERVTVADRLHFASFMQRKMWEDLEGRINEKTEQYIAVTRTLREHPENTRDAQVLDKELKELTKKREELEELDFFALGHVLAAYPTDGPPLPSLDEKTIGPMLEAKYRELDGQYRAELRKGGAERNDELIQELKAQLEHLGQLKKALPTLNIYTLVMELERYPLDDLWLKPLAPVRKLVQGLVVDLKPHVVKGKFQKMKEFTHLSKKQDLGEDEVNYILDVVGMLYTTRWDYSAFCKSQKIDMKNEGMADILMREAVLFAEDREAYDGRGFSLSTLGESFTPGYFPGMARLAPRAIPEADEALYGSLAGPAGLGEKAEAELEAQRETQLRDDLLAHYEDIEWAMEEPPEEPELEPEPGFLRRNGWDLATGGAVAAAGVAGFMGMGTLSGLLAAATFLF